VEIRKILRKGPTEFSKTGRALGSVTSAKYYYTWASASFKGTHEPLTIRTNGQL